MTTELATDVTADNHQQATEKMIAGLLIGNEDSYRVFWECYGKRLDGVARKYMPRGLARRMEPADVVQSVCKSFFRRATGGEIQLTDADSLWGLLCAITLNKMRMKQRFHMAKKRALSREQDVSGQDERSAPVAVAKGESPDETVMFEDQFDELMTKLEKSERRILRMKMDGYTNTEIAAKLDCSERTVRRVMVRMRSKLINSLVK